MQTKNKKLNEENKFGLAGVGPQIAKHLARLQIHNVKDLLLHLPIRYQDRTKISSIRSLMVGEEAVVEGTITAVDSQNRGRTKLQCVLSDGNSKLHLRFFHVYQFQTSLLQVGVKLRCFGEVRLGPKGLEIFHPEFKVIQPHKPIPVDQYLTPFYPATEGLSQYMLRKLIGNALEVLTNTKIFIELLPQHFLKQHAFPTINEAIFALHRPKCETDINALHNAKSIAHKRLIFEELLAHRISLLHVKRLFQTQQSISLTPTQALIMPFLQTLPFNLTTAQERVNAEISADLIRHTPMLRLVQGDVGSGKTVVAAIAMLQAIENAYQAALMAPTELLVHQHYQTLKNWFTPLGIKVGLLTGQITLAQRKKLLRAIAEGEILMVVGTHALFQKDVVFKSLALVVTDEQHRFGVEQRAQFREKGMQMASFPHQLIMTATPIPRTLAMSFYADLDCSLIDELPPGRIPIRTSVIASNRRDEVIERLQHAFQNNQQAYWVCALIDESEKINCQSAIATAEELQNKLPQFKIGLIHGKLKNEEKESIMQAFKAGNIQLLVATTVIEVGVDVPNAAVMVIDNAERLGLSQLHQLRGRVGRGCDASHCILLYHYPLSELAKSRLAVMRETTDGFKIAQRDLELRGPGEILGTRQTGDLCFKVADLIRDEEMLTLVQPAADEILKQHAEIIDALIARWVGDNKEYGKV